MKTTRPTSNVPTAARLAQWGIVFAAGLLAWSLMMLGAIWRGPFLVLFFPAGWCLYVALRQFRQLRDGPTR